MKQFKVPAGTVQNLQTVFEKVHSFFEDNINRRVLKLFETFGVVTNQVNGVIQSGQNDLKVSLNTGLQFFIAPGTGIAQDGDVLRVASQATGQVTSPATPAKI